MTQNNQAAGSFHTFLDYDDAHISLPGIIIPQRVYTPRQNQPSAILHEPIRFTVDGKPGLRLSDALVSNFSGLENADTQPPLTSTGTRVSLRIHWPGYDIWTHENAIVAGGQHNPRTLTHIAYQAAARISEFYQEQLTVAGAEPDWDLHNFPFESLFLVELRHVSGGSWQPVIYRSF